MKTSFIGAGVLAAGVALAAAGFAAGPASAQQLTITSWGGTYQDAQRAIYFEPFSEETGVEIVEDEYNGGIGVLRAQVMGGAPTWNIVQVEAEELILGCEEGLYVPIDYEKLDYSQDDFIAGAATECGVGTIVWSTQIGYDATRVQDPPKSWADFWDTEKWPGSRGLRRGPKYTLEFALMADGVAPAEVYDVLRTEEGVERAFAKLDELKDNLIWWEAGAQPLQMLAAGEVVMTSIYNGRMTGSNRDEGTNFAGVWPGSIYAIDSWVILEGTPDVELAHRFINFASDPKRQAKMPEHIAYGTTVKAAADEVPEEYLADLPTTPKNLEGAIELDTEFWVENIESLTERFERWAAN
jgi:putative spermidine/putrescine transport system substrate-binding protein